MISTKTQPDPEFIEARAFLAYFFAHHMDRAHLLPTERHPIAVLDDMARHAPGRARVGLKMAVNDILEQTARWELAQVLQLDSALRAEGIITLSELRYRRSQSFRRVVKRGKIRTEVEYYLLRGIVESMSLAAEEEARLQSMLNMFEVEAARSTKP